MKIALLVLLMIVTAIDNQINAQTIDISDEKFSFDLDYYIEDVILAQKEKEIMGFKVMQRKALSFNKPIEQELKDFFNRNLPLKENKKPLILRINKLHVTGENDRSTTELNISFILKKDNNYTELLNTGTINIHNWVSLVINSTSKKYGKNLINAFKECFTDFCRRSKNNNLKPRPQKEGNLEHLYNPNFIILNNPMPLKGVLYGLSDFIDNVIDTTIKFSIDRNVASDTHNIQIKFPEVIKNSIWGICDGENYYLNFGNTYYPIKIQQNSVNTFIDSHILSTNADLGGMVGGLIGYVMFSAVEASSSKIVKIEIDLFTGKFMQINRLKGFVFDCVSNKNKEEICIYLEDERLGCLKKGEFLRYENNNIEGIEKFILKTNTTTKIIYCSSFNEQYIKLANKQNVIATTYTYIFNPKTLNKYLLNKKKEVKQSSFLMND